MKHLKPAEILRRYRAVERRQYIIYILFVALVATVLPLSLTGALSDHTVALLLLGIMALGGACYHVRRCPVCGLPLFPPLRFMLPLECPHCYASFTSGLNRGFAPDQKGSPDPS